MQIPVVAFYWSGGVPSRYEVKSVSAAGAYIFTQDRWYPGTIVAMNLQYDPYYLRVAKIAGNGKASIRMQAKIVRFGSDGVEVRFVYLNKQQRRRFEKFLRGAEVRGAA